MIGMIGVSVRLAVGITLALAGILKCAKRPDLAPIARSLGVPLGSWFSSVVPLLAAVEIILGGWLIVGGWSQIALAATLVLLTTFTIVLITTSRRGYRGACACFGALDSHQVGATQHLRNGVLLLGTTFVLVEGLNFEWVNAAVWEVPKITIPTTFAMLIVASILYRMSSEIEAFLRR